MPETSLSSSAASSAAAQAGPLPNTTAFARLDRTCSRPPTPATPREAVVDLLGQARERARKGRVGRELRPHPERGHDVAAERLGVGDGPLVGNGDERARSGARPDRRARCRGHCGVRGGRAPVDRLDQVAELARRGDGQEHVTRAPREGVAREQSARHGQDLRSLPPFQRREPERQADVVRRAVPARHDALHAGSAEHRSDVGEAGPRVERCRERLRQLGQVAPQAGLVQHGRNPIHLPRRASRRRRCHRRDPARRRPRARAGVDGYSSSGRQAASTRSLNAGLGAEPAAEHDHRGVERVGEHGEHPAELCRRRVDESGVRRVGEHVLGPLGPGRERERAAARDALDRRRAERDRVPARAGVRRPVDDQADARARADDREQERGLPGAGAERRLGERRRPHVRLEDDARRRDRGGEIEVAPVDRVGARGAAVEADELAQPDPDRERAPRRAAPPTRRSPPAPPRPPRSGRVGSWSALVQPARGHVDETGGDLRPADVDADRERHGCRRRLAFSIAL